MCSSDLGEGQITAPAAVDYQQERQPQKEQGQAQGGVGYAAEKFGPGPVDILWGVLMSGGLVQFQQGKLHGVIGRHEKTGRGFGKLLLKRIKDFRTVLLGADPLLLLPLHQKPLCAVPVHDP